MEAEVGLNLKWTVEAVVTRADGTVENLGILGETTSPFFPGLPCGEVASTVEEGEE